MKNRKERLLLGGGYALFALLSFLVSLYLTFPFELLGEKAIRLIEAKGPCRISVDQSGFALPARLSFQGFRATCPKRLFFKGKSGELQLKLDSADIALSPLPFLLNRRGEVDVGARLFGGRLSGHLSVEEGAAGERSYTFRAEGAALQLAAMDPGLSGRLGLKGEGAWNDKNPLAASGQLAFSLDGGTFKAIGGWAIPTGALAFSSLEGRLSMRGGRVMLESFSARGESLDLPSGSGSLLLRSPVENSILSLSARALPKAGLQKLISMVVLPGYKGRELLKVQVSGPLRAPGFSLNGKRL